MLLQTFTDRDSLRARARLEAKRLARTGGAAPAAKARMERFDSPAAVLARGEGRPEDADVYRRRAGGYAQAAAARERDPNAARDVVREIERVLQAIAEAVAAAGRGDSPPETAQGRIDALKAQLAELVADRDALFGEIGALAAATAELSAAEARFGDQEMDPTLYFSQGRAEAEGHEPLEIRILDDAVAAGASFALELSAADGHPAAGLDAPIRYVARRGDGALQVADALAHELSTRLEAAGLEDSLAGTLDASGAGLLVRNLDARGRLTVTARAAIGGAPAGALADVFDIDLTERAGLRRAERGVATAAGRAAAAADAVNEAGKELYGAALWEETARAGGRVRLDAFDAPALDSPELEPLESGEEAEVALDTGAKLSREAPESAAERSDKARALYRQLRETPAE